MTALPEPGPEARAHSQRLAQRIRAEIEAAGGWISFARYMELALYAPGLGYYAGGSTKLGAAGDFVTAPELSPLFGRALARQAAEVLAETGGDLLELGPGSGALACELLAELERLGQPPRRCLLLEVSPELRGRQEARLRARLPQLAGRVEWLDALPQRFTGMLLANEVLDALPVHLLCWQEGGAVERGVAWEGEGFAWRERPLPVGALLEFARRLALPAGYLSEVAPATAALAASLARTLERGAALIIDYGFGRAEYYHPQRSRGTLMCHYRHRAHDDPFLWPGLTDITAHIDFSAVAEAAHGAGAGLLGYTTQAHFLVNCGITGLLAETPAEDAAAYAPLASQVQRLLSPAEMGELFKALAFGKGLRAPLAGFARGDLSRLL